MQHFSPVELGKKNDLFDKPIAEVTLSRTMLQ